MKRPRDRGSILVLALLVAAAGSIAGMWLVISSDLRVRANRYLGRAGFAARLASSGLQLARIKLGLNPGVTSLAAPGLAADEAISVTVSPLAYLVARATSTGALGDATQAVQADLRAVGHPALEFNVLSGGALHFADVTVGGRLRANGDVSAAGDVDFTGTIETLDGSAVAAQIEEDQVSFLASPLALPVVDFAAYAGLSSPLLGLPTDADSGALTLARLSLTPSTNPYGPTNSAGAYILDAAGADVLLSGIYVRGTLTIVDAGLVTVANGYYHERADPSLATLLVDGDLDLRLDADLVESAAGRDMNGDGDFLDLFPATVDGIVVAIGSFSGPYGGTMKGLIAAGDVTLAGYPFLTSAPALASQPVRSFTLPGSFDIVPGSIAGVLP